MIDNIHYPTTLSSVELDEYLLKGWFRMNQSVFTTSFVFDEKSFYPVYWLRVNISLLNTEITHKKIYASNRSFSVEIKPLSLSDELELLYQLYISSLSFQPADSLHQLLYGKFRKNVFDSWVIMVRDQGKLIAAGIFDKGEDSIAGIVNFYDPSYKKHSLGKYLMLLKKDHAVAAGKKFYYPGYISTTNDKFDYKLFVDRKATEVLVRYKNCWLPYDEALLNGMLDLELHVF